MILGWPKSSYGFFCNTLRKNPNRLFGQLNICIKCLSQTWHIISARYTVEVFATITIIIVLIHMLDGREATDIPKHRSGWAEAVFQEDLPATECSLIAEGDVGGKGDCQRTLSLLGCETKGLSRWKELERRGKSKLVVLWRKRWQNSQNPGSDVPGREKILKNSTLSSKRDEGGRWEHQCCELKRRKEGWLGSGNTTGELLWSVLGLLRP